jgi:tetratricopeptide (TPR) repeat protein
MRKNDHLRGKYENCQDEFDLLTQKIKRLRMARVIEPDITTQVKLEAQITQAEKELDDLESEITKIEEEMRLNESAFPTVTEKSEALTSSSSGIKTKNNNLPKYASSFVGRNEDVRKAVNKLKKWRHLVIEGVGGVGKSFFAEMLGLQLIKTKTVDGVVWIDCKYQQISIDDVINIFASTLDYRKLHSLDSTSKVNLAIDLLQHVRCLFILDNYETTVNPELTSWLVNLPEPTMIIFTIRKGKEFLNEDLAVITLKGLSKESSLELINREAERLGKSELANYADEIFQKTYSLINGLPLAIKWICSQIGLNGRTIESVVADLQSAQGNFYDSLFYSAYDGLQSDIAKQILQVLSLFVTPVNIDVLYFIFSQTSLNCSVENSISELTQYNLIEVTGGITVNDRKYALHPITQSYAASLLSKDQDHYEKIQRRVVQFFKELVENFGGDENWQGYKILDVWHENIIHFIHLCYQQKLWDLVIGFVKNYHYYLWARGYWEQREEVGLLAVQASQELHDSLMEVWIKTRVLFDAHLLLGDFLSAEKCLEEAISIASSLEDKSLVGWAFYQKGRLLRRTKDLDLAKTFAVRSVEIYEHLQDECNLAYTLNGLANVENDLKEYSLAENHYQQSLKIFDLTTDEMMKAVVTRNLARLYRNRKDYAMSIASYKSAVLIFERLGLELETAESKSGLAETLIETNDNIQASELLRISISILKKLGALHEIRIASSTLERLQDNQGKD